MGGVIECQYANEPNDRRNTPVTLLALAAVGLLEAIKRERRKSVLSLTDEISCVSKRSKRLIGKRGVSVGKVTALLENKNNVTQGNWASFTRRMLTGFMRSGH